MARSYRRLHYGLRPAKNVERKLIAEILARLDHVHPLRDFRYVGLGSLYFVDFSLFHRRLGFTEMISIEDQNDADVQARFEFNRPFDAQLVFGHTTDVLPGLLVDPKPSVIWLDYDGGFNSDAVTDLETVVRQATPPTAFLVTVNVDPGQEEERIERFSKDLGPETSLPGYIRSNVDLGGEGLAGAIYELVGALVESTLADRNAALEPEVAVEYRQLFHFRYRDGARMLTLGGLLYRRDQQGDVDQCRFDDLEFCMDGDEPFGVGIPLLTLRETMTFDQGFPHDEVDIRGVPPSELAAYKRLYRHMPAWIDADL